jgi:hypothetical protein
VKGVLQAQPRARNSINGSPAQIVEGLEAVDRGVACLCALAFGVIRFSFLLLLCRMIAG